MVFCLICCNSSRFSRKAMCICLFSTFSKNPVLKYCQIRYKSHLIWDSSDNILFFKICQLNLCATCVLRVCYRQKSTTFQQLFPKRKHKKNPCKHWVCKGFGNLFEIVKTISLITPNAYFRSFFKHLFVTCVLHIKPRLVSRCFIIS
jgi:hypothetical protein